MPQPGWTTHPQHGGSQIPLIPHQSPKREKGESVARERAREEEDEEEKGDETR